MSKEMVLHPSRYFLNARNPSSPFQYEKQMCNYVWRYINENAAKDDGCFCLVFDGVYIFANTKQELFDLLKNKFM